MKIGFIDYSREERNKILSTLSLLGENAALDELGIGTVRDAYADILFPGISTLQTRAKYFVLIPYLFDSAREQVEKGRIHSAKDMMQWIRQGEDRLVATLCTNCPEEIGIIGKNAYKSKRSVKISPDTIYWNGLRTFGILRKEIASSASACKLICSAAKRKAELEIKTEGETFDDPTAADQGSVLFLPLKPDYEYEKQAIMSLSRREAEFLEDCIQKYVPDSLLAYMVSNRIVCDRLDSVPEEQMGEKLRTDYRLAKDFSRFIYGAHIRYNVIYSNGTDENMLKAFHEWRENFLESPFELDPVLKRVFCNTKLTVFCKMFLDAVIRDDPKAMDDCIIQRERTVKDARAKLCKPDEYRYDPDNPIHFFRLDYRYNTAKVIIRDILKGLEAGEHV